jgi:TolA-binding protein
MSQSNPESINTDSYDREALIDMIEQQQQQIEQQQQQINELQENSQQQQQQINELQEKVESEADKRSAVEEGVHNRISEVEAKIEDTNPTPEPSTSANNTPIEQLSKANDVSEVTDSPTVQRAVSLFKNLPQWGSKTPKGIVLKPADNPLSLLEADRDESLAWKQYYRAAEALEQLSEGSVTFFDSDRHGKMIVLHKQSDAYERVVNGSLSSSSVGAKG